MAPACSASTGVPEAKAQRKQHIQEWKYTAVI
jgi:hypothetical protein